MRNHTIGLVLTCLVPTACDSDSPAGGADATSDATGPDGADTTPSETTPGETTLDPFMTWLQGEWHIPCTGTGGGYYGLSHLLVSGSRVTNTYIQYSGDPTCSDDSKRVARNIVVDSSWTVGGASGDGLALDMVLAETTVEIFDATTLSAWNSGSGCGPFELDAVTDVAGRTCWGYWRPTAGTTYYSIIGEVPTGFLFGATNSGDMKTEATRSTRLDPAAVWTRVGAASGDGFIEGTIGGATYRAEKNVAGREVQRGHIQIGATTEAVTPWETWIVNVPNAVGTYACDDDSINAYINFGFTQDNLPVLWDTEQDGGAGCTITVTKAAANVGDSFEGTFEGTLGDGDAGHEATAGSFEVVRAQ